MPNRLANSSSPYLRQHADNPIDWREWGEEVWAEATALNKPVFLSVGYSSCHWCHVMAHESFEDAEVANALNQDFLCIKLDREQRPDVDDIYMTAVQFATGHGGWPMSVFLTPEKQPFFAGTYFPRQGHGGVPGFLQIVRQLGAAWKEQESEVRAAADQFTEGLEQVLEKSVAPLTDKIEVSMLDQSIQAFHQDFDYERGGTGFRPKFPPHSALQFWLDYANRRDELPGDPGSVAALGSDAGHMALLTLEQMARGGIRDHVGGGFHRYSTDEKWLLPHFEKMLYDNAQLLGAYTAAAKIAASDDLRSLFDEVAKEIVKFVRAELSSPSGVFYCAIDADSEGEEGAFYTWNWNDLLSVDPDESLWRLYGCDESGNFEDEASGSPTGKNILHLRENCRRDGRLDLLLERRAKRERPTTDDKAILAWNGLMIGALAQAGETEMASQCATAWLENDLSALPHEISGGQPFGLAFLDDYAFFADGLIDLHESTGESAWLEAAHHVANSMAELFAEERGGFCFISDKHELLFGKTMPAMDSATPSPNGVAIRVMRRLGRNEEALKHLTAVYGWAQRLPNSSATILRECLHQLLLAGGETSVQGKPSASFSARLADTELSIGEGGSATTTLIIELPAGCHIYSNDPHAQCDTPTSVVVEGAYAEAAFPDSDDGKYDGIVEIPLRFHARGSSGEFEVSVTAQVCTDTECFAPTTMRLPGRLILTNE